MQTSEVLIGSPIGVLAVLCAVAAFFFLFAQVTDAKLFKYVPPLLFIYATPVFLNNFDVIPSESNYAMHLPRISYYCIMQLWLKSRRKNPRRDSA